MERGCRSSRRAARQRSIEDFVVCGLPFSILRNINISPHLPADKTATIGRRYVPISNFIETRSPGSKQRGIGGLKIARTDTGIDRLWHDTG